MSIREDYERYVMIGQYEVAMQVLQHVDKALEIGGYVEVEDDDEDFDDEDVTDGDEPEDDDHGGLDPEMLELLANTVRPELAEAIQAFEAAYDGPGIGSDKLREAAAAMLDACDRAHMNAEAALPTKDEDFDIKNL